MGFLFFLAGYFVPRAFEAKGATRFLRDRAIRLGIPTLVFMLIIHPVMVYWLLLRFYDPDGPALDAVYERYIMTGLTFLISGLLRPVLPGLRRIL